jgi:hypothetical protein
MNKPITAQQLKQRFEAVKNEPLPEGLEVTCICGKCDLDINFTDEDFEEMARIINGSSQEKTP